MTPGDEPERKLAAIAVQTALADHNDPAAPSHRIVLRIVLHQGDVVVQGSDLLGDGVNIAAVLVTLPGEPTVVGSAASLLHSLVVVSTAPDGPPLDYAAALTAGPLTVGRQPPSGLFLSGGEVSRAHCRVERTNHGVTVTDLGSTSGTFIDDRRITAAELHPGSLLRIGQDVLRHVVDHPHGADAPDATRVERRGPPPPGAATGR